MSSISDENLQPKQNKPCALFLLTAYVGYIEAFLKKISCYHALEMLYIIVCTVKVIDYDNNIKTRQVILTSPLIIRSYQKKEIYQILKIKLLNEALHID